MLRNRIRLILEQTPVIGRGRFRLHAWIDDGRDFAVAEMVTFSKADPGLVSEPMFDFGEDTAQELLDQLWQAGLRPTKAVHSQKDLIETLKEEIDTIKGLYESHTGDLREILNKMLDKK